MAKQKKDLSLIVWAFGWLLALVTAIKKIASRLKVPFDAFDRLGSPEGEATIEKIVEIIFKDWQTEQSGEKASSTFSAWVVYDQPKYDDLKRHKLNHVQHDFRYGKFSPIDRCKSVSCENREVAFEYVCIGHAIRGDDEVLAEMNRLRLRPALYEELLGFAEKYFDESLKHPIVAIGSRMESMEKYQCVAGLKDNGLDRQLFIQPHDFSFNGDCRFLAVREGS